MLLAVGLSATYFFASIGKLQNRQALEDYVRPIARRHSRTLVGLIIGVELVLGLSLAGVVVEPAIARGAGIGSATFLAAATGFYAVLLALGQPVTCRCFGRLSVTSDRIDPAWEPAVFGLRNGALGAASVAVVGVSFTGMVAAATTVAMLLVVGLLESLRRQRALLHGDSHPLRAASAPTMSTLQAHAWWVNGHPRRF